MNSFIRKISIHLYYFEGKTLSMVKYYSVFMISSKLGLKVNTEEGVGVLREGGGTCKEKAVTLEERRTKSSQRCLWSQRSARSNQGFNSKNTLQKSLAPEGLSLRLTHESVPYFCVSLDKKIEKNLGVLVSKISLIVLFEQKKHQEQLFKINETKEQIIKFKRLKMPRFRAIFT